MQRESVAWGVGDDVEDMMNVYSVLSDRQKF